MSDEDLQYQLNLLRVCLNIDNYNFSKLRNNHLELDVKKLVRESIFNVPRPYALTLQKDSSGNYIYGESNLGLYEGKLGLLLSYDELEEIFDLKVIEQEIINSKDIGLINGYASLLLYKNLNNSLNKDDYLLHDIDFTEFDIIDGLGGLILQSYLIFLKKPELVDVVELKKLGEIFLELTKNQEQFKVGFAHGFTGIKVIYKICYLVNQILSVSLNFICHRRFRISSMDTVYDWHYNLFFVNIYIAQLVFSKVTDFFLSICDDSRTSIECKLTFSKID
ncbi:hypothetical protein [Streptococcus suis]|uniref:hypothetical protein n=1 Tax=Streptococcus suis TaxID=1307 RepID=UPI001CEF0183|nr:hypothetical protein [Streptococcus suis]MDG3108581.1 hypothetical protein [Streptococcus suis]MDG3114750.1 hypothetical protein [Streptococcus suis]MDG3124015.1 hypothetical protein [Streptococcus suis]MDG3147294.1 hypothetical protein [Streptococcus suis]MDG3168745.1 hypothetical protein [Streptococcus suis]